MDDQEDMLGMAEMVIHADKQTGKVVQRFNRPMLQVEYDPDNLCDVACAMTDAAFELREGKKPASDTLKSELIERHRRTLTQRVTLILNSQRERRKISSGKLAQNVVEACLKEIF